MLINMDRTHHTPRPIWTVWYNVALSRQSEVLMYSEYIEEKQDIYVQSDG
jgi:hypothetical protein